MKLRTFVSAIAAAVFVAAALRRGDAPESGRALRLDPSISARSMPPPTEHVLDDGAERRNKDERKRWREEMHRAAPGVDWRAIERENGEREMQRRTELARAPGPRAWAPSWTEVGSKNQAGRMHCAVIAPDGVTLYAGSSLGGLWRRDALGTWTPLGDDLYGGVHEVVALPGENAGDPDVLVTWSPQAKVRVSRDLGATWEQPSGLASLTSAKALAVFQDAARTIVIWAQTAYISNAPALFASTDHGRTFSIRYQMQTAGDSSAWIPRTGPGAASTVYVAHRGALFRSTDGGYSFQARATIDAGADRAVLAGSEAGAPTLYVALRNGGWKIYRSDDAGQSATLVHTPTDFWEEMCASIASASTVLYGGVEVFRSTSGGASFAKINGWTEYYASPATKLHADTMGLHCWPDPPSPGGERWFLSTDGGTYQSTSGGASPQNLCLTGLGVGQYYSTLTSVTNEDLILAGSQDQGYQRGSRDPPSGPGPSTNMHQLISGDYGHLTSSDGTHALVYSNYPGFTLVQQDQAQPALVGFVDFPGAYAHLWLPPVVADPLDGASYFLCASRLLRFTRATPSSSTWNFVEHSTRDFAAGAGNYLTALAFAPGDPQRAYAIDDASRTWYSTDRGVTWTQGSTSAPGEHYFYGNAIAVNPSDALEALVGGSGYSTAGVRRTLDGGATWQALASGLPSTLVYDLAFAGDGSGDVYAATEAGAYRFDRAASQWVNVMGSEAPITLYWSVEAVGDYRMRFGTYGRGIWDYDYERPPPWVATYCTAKTNSDGCTPEIGYQGTPSASAATPFDVTASLVLSGKSGLLFYGYQPAAAPFQGGTKCAAAPIRRTPIQSSSVGAGACSGAFAYDFNAEIQSGGDPALAVDAVVYCQYWYRDPFASFTSGLTDGLSFTIGP